VNDRLKTILKVAAAVAIPGAGIYFGIKWLAQEVETHEFREYVRKTYGKGSKYEEENVDR
jgi:hypothetical protein